MLIKTVEQVNYTKVPDNDPTIIHSNILILQLHFTFERYKVQANNSLAQLFVVPVEQKGHVWRIGQRRPAT